MDSNTTIAIVTKSRPIELNLCLFSISQQTILPGEVLIIDNDPLGSAKELVKKYKKSGLKINYLKGQGTVPKCRNLALKSSKTKYLGFVDDDCVLNSKWLEAGLNCLASGKFTFVLGKTRLLNFKNVIAVAQHQRDAYWKKHNGYIFDTKNVLLNVDTIKQLNLKFDEQCQSSFYDSADFDFDFQVREVGLKGTNYQRMVLFHKETFVWSRFVGRAYHRGRLGAYLDKKWRLGGKLSGGRDANLILWLARCIKNFAHSQQQYQTKPIPTFFIRVFDRYYARGYEGF